MLFDRYTLPLILNFSTMLMIIQNQDSKETERLVARLLKVDKILLTALPQHPSNDLLLALSFSKQVNLIPVKETTIHGDLYYLVSQSQIGANKDTWKVDLFAQDPHGHKEKIGESHSISLNTIIDNLLARLSYNSQLGTNNFIEISSINKFPLGTLDDLY